MTTDSKNKTYTASLLFRSLHDGIFSPANLWEESIVLIQAATQTDAKEKALAIGGARQLSYMTSDGVELSWDFFGVERIFEVEEPLKDGVEIFSRHLRNAEVESLLTSFDE